jgi:hypothetical protein
MNWQMMARLTSLTSRTDMSIARHKSTHPLIFQPGKQFQ